MGSVILKFLAGAAAGLLTGLITEPMAPTVINSGNWNRWEQITILMIGGLLGALVGGLDGISKGGVWALRGLGLGALFGMIGSTFGYALGGGLAIGMLGSSWVVAGPMPKQMIGHMIVFVGIGVFVGAAIGGSALSVRKAVQGAIGGLIGGAVAGLLFDPVGAVLGQTILAMRGQTAGEVGGPSRMIGWVVLGAMVALMIGLVDRFARQAWLRADYGRKEFKEWPLDAATNYIGKGETCHIVLRGDPQVAPVHASIARQGAHFVISDAGAPAGTFVNGHRIGQASLQPGDVVQVGGTAMRFMTKSHQVAYAPHFPAPQMPQYPRPPFPAASPMAPGPAAPGPMAPAPQGSQPTVAFQPMPANSHPTVAFGASPVMGPTLVAMDGPLAGQRFPLVGALEIGREASGIALMGDANASRRHASVAPAPGGVQVTDLDSTNGTFVDGARVGSALARPGSLVRVGSTTFRIE